MTKRKPERLQPEKHELVQDEWDHLLDWLAPDREQAGQKYEEIRQRLISILIARGMANAEDITDQAFDRTARKLPELRSGYTGDPALYIYGIAYKLLLEQKHQLYILPPPVSSDSELLEQESGCLKKCLAELSEEKRSLILAYYRDGKEEKKIRRKKIAAHLDLSDNTLKLQIHRIKANLQACLGKCRER